MQLQPVIHIAPDGHTAKGRWRAIVLLGQFHEYARWQTGPYECEYRKEHGVWKISKLHWVETFTVPVRGRLEDAHDPEQRRGPQAAGPGSAQFLRLRSLARGVAAALSLCRSRMPSSL